MTDQTMSNQGDYGNERRMLAMQTTIDELMWHITEINRRISHMIRPCTVVSFDPVANKAVVDIGAPESPAPTIPLPVGSHGGATKHWQPLSPGQLVTLLSPDGDPGNGYIVGAGYTDATSKPSSSSREHVMAQGEGQTQGATRARDDGIVIHQVNATAKMLIHQMSDNTWWSINPQALLPAPPPPQI